MSIDKKQEICIVSKAYSKEWDDFLHLFVNYKTRICIDNISTYTGDILLENRDDIIHMNIDDCEGKGFKNSSTCANFAPVIAWDKALCYYITEYVGDADYIWFIEDDVFFLDENTLRNIDTKYGDEDLLTTFHDVNETGELDSWNHWINIVDCIDLPWCHSMICACRISLRLLKVVGEYVKLHGELFFIEVIFNTLAHQNNMRIANPVELSTIQWFAEWDKDNIDTANIYHPFKNIEDHLYMRQKYK